MTVLTDEEWHHKMLERLDTWIDYPRPKPNLLKHMHMNLESFMAWRATKIVPKEVRLLYAIFPEYWEQ